MSADAKRENFEEMCAVGGDLCAVPIRAQFNSRFLADCAEVCAELRRNIPRRGCKVKNATIRKVNLNTGCLLSYKLINL